MLKVISFDVDGTLVNTDETVINTWLELYKVYKPKDFKPDIEKARTFSGPPLTESLTKEFPEYDYDFILEQYKERTVKYYDNDIKFFPNVEETLIKLKKDGYKLAILTSKNRYMTLYTLKLANLDANLFDYIVAGDEVSKNKPDPEGLKKIMAHFYISNNELLNIGDTEYDLGAGENAHVDTILMTMCKRKYKSIIHPYKFVNSYNELYEVIKNYDNK